MIEMVVLIVFTVENDFLRFKKFTLAKLPFLTPATNQVVGIASKEMHRVRYYYLIANQIPWFHTEPGSCVAEAS